MTKRCPRGSVRLGSRLALRVLDWHGGGGTAAYAVGSTGYAGHCVSQDRIRDAIREFKNVLATSGKLAPVKPLGRLVATLEKKAGG